MWQEGDDEKGNQSEAGEAPSKRQSLRKTVQGTERPKSKRPSVWVTESVTRTQELKSSPTRGVTQEWWTDDSTRHGRSIHGVCGS